MKSNESLSQPKPINIGGTFPHLGVKAGHSPARSETGIRRAHAVGQAALVHHLRFSQEGNR